MTGSDRHLAAILSADIVAYSRLMSLAEDAAVQQVQKARENVARAIERHRGRLVDFTGDNFLAEFASVAEALRCAVGIHRSFAARETKADRDPALQFRMGLHLGDVRAEGPHLFGEGVIVAARLESLADPGGLCVSASVRDQVKREPGLSFEDRGLQPLKNLPDPVQVFSIHWDERGERPPLADAGARPTVAVLPFANMSPDPDQEYFADGMAEELINALAKVDGLRVIARTSAFSLKGSNADVATVGSRLNASAIVEGSVRRAGSRLRISAQLVDVAGGHQLWSEVFDREVKDVFEVQDEIARTIVRTIGPKLLGRPDSTLVHPATESPAAYELFLRSGERIAVQNPWDTRTAIAMLEGAVADDPGFAGAWARLAHGCCQMAIHFDPDPRGFRRTDEAMERALALDPANAEARVVEGRLLWSRQRGYRCREALHALSDAMRLQPGAPAARIWHSLILLHIGLMDEAAEGLEEARALEPANPRVLTFIAQNHYLRDALPEAQDCLERAFALDPTSFYSHLFQPAVHLYAEDLPAAERSIQTARRVIVHDAVLDACEALLWAKRGEVAQADEFLARASAQGPSLMHTHHVSHWRAAAQAVLGRTREASESLREAAATGMPNHPALRNDRHFAEAAASDEMSALFADLEEEWRAFRAEFGRADQGNARPQQEHRP